MHAIREFDPHGPDDVPDPYSGGEEGFEEVRATLERSAGGFARHVTARVERPGRN